KRSDADEVRQLGRPDGEFLRDQRAERGIPDAADARSVAGVHQVRAATVIAFLCAESPKDCEMFGHRRELGQMLAEFQAGDAGFDLLELAAVFVPRFEIPSVELARPAG